MKRPDKNRVANQLRELRKKSIEELNAEQLSLLRELFNLRMKVVSSHQMQQTHLIKQVRRSVARVKTLLAEKVGVCND